MRILLTVCSAPIQLCSLHFGVLFRLFFGGNFHLSSGYDKRICDAKKTWHGLVFLEAFIKSVENETSGVLGIFKKVVMGPVSKYSLSISNIEYHENCLLT